MQTRTFILTASALAALAVPSVVGAASAREVSLQAMKQTSAAVTTIRNAFVAGRMTADQAQAHLAAVGEADADQSRLLDIWGIETVMLGKSGHTKTIGKSHSAVGQFRYPGGMS